MVTQPNLVEALQYQQQQQGILSRHPIGKVGGAPFGNEVAAVQQQQQLHNFQHQQQYSKAQAALVHSQQRGALPTHPMMPHPLPPATAAVELSQIQQQQMMERQQRENADSNKSGLSISALPFVPTSNTPPTSRKFNSSTPNVGEGIPPPSHSVSAMPVAVGGHVTRPNAPLLQHVVLPAHHMVPTPPAPPPTGGMLPLPRMHVSNPAQFGHPAQRKTSASSAVPPQGQSILGGPAYQVIDKPHHPTGTVSRQLSGEGGSTGGGGGGKPPPGLSLPIRPNVMGEQGTTPTPPGVMMAGLDLQARTMAVNRSGHALVNTAPTVGYATVRAQHPHHLHELSIYGAPPKMQPNVTTGGNKRALLPTPTAAGPIPTQLSFLAGGAHHMAAAPTASLPPVVQSWSGANMRVPQHRVPPPSVTNPNSHRQQVIYTQEQVVQRSNYGGGYSGRGNGGM